MELILAFVIGPSVAVFLGGCLLAITRTITPQLRAPVRLKQRGRPI
jgi:HAMP domain-containing protein